MSSYRTNAHRSRLIEPEEGAQRSPEAEVVDATGLKCPEPVMMLHNAIRKAQPGGHVLLQATDPSTQRDVPQFCKFLEHQLLDISADEAAGRYSYLIEKQPS